MLGFMSPTTYGEVLASNIRAARSRAGLMQEPLATRMRALGFTAWQRQTVRSVEKGVRRVTAEEVLGLSLAMATTVQRLLTPLGEDKWVQLPSGEHLNVEAVAHLVAGVNDGVLQWYGDSPYRVGPAAGALEFEVLWRSDESGRRPVVAAIVTSPDGVLAGKRVDGKPPWTFIAGENEAGEALADTAVREVKEEAGLIVRVGRIIGDRVHPDTRRVMVYMSARPTHGTSIFVGDEAELSEVRWLSLAEADELLPGMDGRVREYLERELAGS